MERTQKKAITWIFNAADSPSPPHNTFHRDPISYLFSRSKVGESISWDVPRNCFKSSADKKVESVSKHVSSDSSKLHRVPRCSKASSLDVTKNSGQFGSGKETNYFRKTLTGRLVVLKIQGFPFQGFLRFKSDFLGLCRRFAKAGWLQLVIQVYLNLIVLTQPKLIVSLHLQNSNTCSIRFLIPIAYFP